MKIIRSEIVTSESSTVHILTIPEFQHKYSYLPRNDTEPNDVVLVRGIIHDMFCSTTKNLNPEQSIRLEIDQVLSRTVQHDQFVKIHGIPYRDKLNYLCIRVQKIETMNSLRRSSAHTN